MSREHCRHCGKKRWHSQYFYKDKSVNRQRSILGSLLSFLPMFDDVAMSLKVGSEAMSLAGIKGLKATAMTCKKCQHVNTWCPYCRVAHVCTDDKEQHCTECSKMFYHYDFQDKDK